LSVIHTRSVLLNSPWLRSASVTFATELSTVLTIA
jgi:hypothetical protein